MVVGLKPRNARKGRAQAVVQRLRPKLARVSGASLFLNPVQDVRVGGRQSNAAYQYTLKGQNLVDLRAWAGRLAEALKAQPALTDVNTDQEDHGLESFVAVDRDKAARLGVTNAGHRQHPLRRFRPAAGLDHLQGRPTSTTWSWRRRRASPRTRPRSTTSMSAPVRPPPSPRPPPPAPAATTPTGGAGVPRPPPPPTSPPRSMSPASRGRWGRAPARPWR